METVERIRLETTVNSRARGLESRPEPGADGDGELWQYGWTHFGTAGQTLARLHSLTRTVEIKDGGEWVRCAPGTDVFFTRNRSIT